MTALILALTAVFAGISIFVQLKRTDLSLTGDPISSTLTGPYGLLEDGAFAVLGLALVLFGAQQPPLMAVVFYLAAAGVLGAMLTKRIPVLLGKPVNMFESEHLLSAAVAFVFVFFGQVAFALHQHLQVAFLFAVLPAIFSLILMATHSDKTPVLEKLSIVVILLSLASAVYGI